MCRSVAIGSSAYRIPNTEVKRSTRLKCYLASLPCGDCRPTWIADENIQWMFSGPAPIPQTKTHWRGTPGKVGRRDQQEVGSAERAMDF